MLAGERYSHDTTYPNPADEGPKLTTWRGWAWTERNSAGDVLCDTALPINTLMRHSFGDEDRKRTFGSGHTPSGANFVMCYGSVRFLNADLNIVVFVRLSVPNDGPVLPDF